MKRTVDFIYDSTNTWIYISKHRTASAAHIPSDRDGVVKQYRPAGTVMADRHLFLIIIIILITVTIFSMKSFFHRNSSFFRART